MMLLSLYNKQHRPLWSNDFEWICSYSNNTATAQNPLRASLTELWLWVSLQITYLHTSPSQTHKWHLIILYPNLIVAQNSISQSDHSPYSSDLAQKDFWLFPKLRSFLKGDTSLHWGFLRGCHKLWGTFQRVRYFKHCDIIEINFSVPSMSLLKGRKYIWMWKFWVGENSILKILYIQTCHIPSPASPPAILNLAQVCPREAVNICLNFKHSGASSSGAN